MDAASLSLFMAPLLNASIVDQNTLNVFNPLIAIALALSLVIIIFYYLLGKAVSSPQIDAFAKEEFSQFVISVLIVGTWISLYGVISAMLSAAACGNANCDQFSMAFFALDVLFYKLRTAYMAFLSIEAILGFFSSVGFSLPLGSPILAVKWWGFNPLGGLGMLSNVVVGVTESIGMLLGLVIGREQLLSLFRDLVPAFLLPVGLLLRGLPFTRVTGSSLIAISFAVFFFFPLSIMFSHYLMFEAQPPHTYIPVVPTPTGLCDPPENEIQLKEDWEYIAEQNENLGNFVAYDDKAAVTYDSAWYKFSSLVADADKNLGEATDNTFHFTKGNLSIVTVVAAMAKPTTVAYVTYYLVVNQFQSVAQISVMVAVTFVLEIIITITGYRAIAAAIGGELEILGLTKVV